MGERASEITREIEVTRAELGTNLRDLEQKVRSFADWRTQFRKTPFWMMGLAFGGGLFLSKVVNGRRAPCPE
jgi:predicted alpha/beta-fold hydrolase